MSIFAIGWSYRQTTGNPAHKAVLVALANFADENGVSYPRVSTLVAMTELSERTVRGAIAELERGGYLSRSEQYRPDGSRAPNIYKLLAPLRELTLDAGGGAGGAPPGSAAAPGGGAGDAGIHLDPSLERSVIEPGRARPRKAKTEINPEMELTPKLLAFANGQGVADIEQEFRRFKAHHQAKGTLHKDWDQAWVSWCLHPLRGEQAAMKKPDQPMLGPGFENLKRYMETHANGSKSGGNGAGAGERQLDHTANERSDDRGVGGDTGRGRLSGGNQRR